MNIRVEMKNTLDKPIVDPVFWLDAFLLDDDSLFIYLVKNMIFRKDLELPLIFILFLKENKIRKKTLSVTPYLEKTVCENRDRSRGQVTYQESMTKDCSTSLSLIMRSLLIKVKQVCQ